MSSLSGERERLKPDEDWHGKGKQHVDRNPVADVLQQYSYSNYSKAVPKNPN